MGVPSARHSICTHQRRAHTARRRTSSQCINATYGSVRGAISDGRPYRESDPLVSQINWDWQTWVHFPIRFHDPILQTLPTPPRVNVGRPRGRGSPRPPGSPRCSPRGARLRRCRNGRSNTSTSGFEALWLPLVRDEPAASPTRREPSRPLAQFEPDPARRFEPFAAGTAWARVPGLDRAAPAVDALGGIDEEPDLRKKGRHQTLFTSTRIVCCALPCASGVAFWLVSTLIHPRRQTPSLPGVYRGGRRGPIGHRRQLRRQPDLVPRPALPSRCGRCCQRRFSRRPTAPLRRRSGHAIAIAGKRSEGHHSPGPRRFTCRGSCLGPPPKPAATSVTASKRARTPPTVRNLTNCRAGCYIPVSKSSLIYAPQAGN